MIRGFATKQFSGKIRIIVLGALMCCCSVAESSRGSHDDVNSSPALAQGSHNKSQTREGKLCKDIYKRVSWPFGRNLPN